MNRLYISFLGLGSYNKEKDCNEYSKTVYKIGKTVAKETEFVQVAEVEIIGPENFDRVLIVATPTSYDTHFENLKQQLTVIGVADIGHLLISEDMSPEGQWAWFEQLLCCIEPEDELTIDLTHGFRSIPIIFSTAINFLQKSKNIRLKAVYYGVYENKSKKDHTPIIDMKDFYIINEWADAVSRLVEDADARKMAATAKQTAGFQVGELNDPILIAAFEDLTNTVRNVDINNIGEKANTAIRLIKEKKTDASPTGSILLSLIIDKFTKITTEEPISGEYNKAYFTLQIAVIRLLLEHKLFMQAYTVMREFIGSIGMIDVKKTKVNNNKGRSRRQQYAEIFIKMVEITPEKWNFKNGENGQKSSDDRRQDLMPFYEKLDRNGVIEILRSFTKELTDYRNGFDHAWTAKKESFADIETKGEKFLNDLEAGSRIMIDKKIIF